MSALIEMASSYTTVSETTAHPIVECPTITATDDEVTLETSTPADTPIRSTGVGGEGVGPASTTSTAGEDTPQQQHWDLVIPIAVALAVLTLCIVVAGLCLCICLKCSSTKWR